MPTIQNVSLIIRGIFCLCLLQSTMTLAQVYTWIDENGQRVYSDKPNSDAETVEIKPLPSYSAPKIQPKTSDEIKKGTEDALKQYDVLLIKSPEQEETIRSNQGNITVLAVVHPDLNENHQLQLILDGKPVLDPGKQTGWQLENVDRGEHQLQVVVVDEQGQTFQSSETVTVHLKRHSILLPNAKVKKQ